MADMFKPDENEMAIAMLEQDKREEERHLQIQLAIDAMLEHEKERYSLIQSAIEQAADISEAIRTSDLTYESDCELKDKMIEFFRTLDKASGNE